MLKDFKKLSYVILFTFIFSVFFIRNSEATKNMYEPESALQTNDIRVTIEAPSPKILPQDPNLWLADLENITLVVNSYNATIIKTYPDFAYSVINVPEESYGNLTNSLIEMGYIVENSTPATLYLNESVSSTGAPYTFGNPGETLIGAGRTIAIIDTGIDINHPDLLSKVVDSYDATGLGIKDYAGHGTFLASVAVGTGANSSGKYKGIAPGANLLIAKAKWEDEYKDSIDWVINHGDVDVISISSGWEATPERCNGTTSESVYKSFYDSIKNAIASGISVVASVGNGGADFDTVEFPACISGVVAVGSSLKKDYADHYYPALMDFFNPGDWGNAYVNVSVEATNTSLSFKKIWVGSSNSWSGFVKVFQTTGGKSTTVKVKIDAQRKDRECYSSATITWDSWSYEMPFFYGVPVVVEVFVKPHYTQGGFASCPLDPTPWYHTWYSDWIDSIQVNFYITSSLSTEGLTYIQSSRGGVFDPLVIAPGVSICAAKAEDTDLGGEGKFICDNNNYIAGTGTSYAAPHVAGLIALLKEATTEAGISEPSPELITETLKKATPKISYGSGPNGIEGYGRINVTKAVDFITTCALKSYKDSEADDPLKAFWGLDDYRIYGYCLDYHWNDDFCKGTYNFDNCVSNYILNETYLSGATCNSRLVNCTSTYGSNYACEAGRCRRYFVADINQDCKVDGKDAAIVSKAFGTVLGNDRWYSPADVNADRKIDGKDIGIIAKKFGWHCPT